MIGLWFSSQDRVLSFLKNQSVQAFCRGCFITFSGSGAVSAIFMLSTISVRSSTSFSLISSTLELLSRGTGAPSSTAAADIVGLGVLPVQSLTHWYGRTRDVAAIWR